MVSLYRPKLGRTVPLELLTPTIEKVSGVTKKTYPETGEIIYGSFRTYGGTEQTVNGVYSIIDTGIVECFYDPRIKSECRIKLTTGQVYEVVNEPENVNMFNQFSRFKVKRVKGNG